MSVAEEFTLIALLEQRAAKESGIVSPKVRFSPARRHPGGAAAALRVGQRSHRMHLHSRSRSPSRSLSPQRRQGSPNSRGATARAEEMLANKMTNMHVARLGDTDKPSFRINTAQRVEPPVGFKVQTRHEVILDDPQNENGLMMLSGNMTQKLDPDAPGSQKKARIPGAVLSRIKDYTMLAAACRRAGRSREEGIANFNIGVLYDNHGDYRKAVACYQQFLEVCRVGKDVQGEALAYNSIAVDLQKIGELDEAIEYHQKHLEVADVPGKFVAHSNLGLCHAGKGEVEKASLNHRQAMRYAILMESLPGESLACGNLAVVRSRKGDHPIAKACMERHLKLSSALGDGKAQADAYEHLGQLANTAGQYQDASQYFELARGAARKTGDVTTATAAKCHVGMALGNLQFDDYIQQVAGRLADTS